MSEGVRLAVLHNLPPHELRPLGDRHDRIVARVVLLVLHEEFCEPLRIKMDLGNDRPVHPRQVGRDQRGLPRVPSEELDDRDPFMGAGRSAEVRDEVDAPGHRR